MVNKNTSKRTKRTKMLRDSGRGIFVVRTYSSRHTRYLDLMMEAAEKKKLDDNKRYADKKAKRKLSNKPKSISMLKRAITAVRNRV